MNAPRTLAIETPDGIERTIRLVAGALKRATEKFGSSDFRAILAEKGPWVSIELLYLMMFDDNGMPPADLTLEWLLENSDATFMRKAYAVVIDACTEGGFPKEEVEAIMLREKDEQMHLLGERLTGLLSKPLPSNVSELNGKSSGGASPSGNSTPTPSAGETERISPTTEPA